MSENGPARGTRRARLSLGNARLRGIVLQAGIVLVFVAFTWAVAINVRDNLSALGLGFGFEFLGHAAGFRIGESPIPYSPADSILRALGVGLLNTLRVAVIGCALATILGTIIGILRLTTNPMVLMLTRLYIELVRNTPLLLQLVLWQVVMLKLPPVRAAFSPLPGIYLSQRGFKLPALEVNVTLLGAAGALALAIALCVANALRARRHQERTGQSNPVWHQNIALLFGMPGLAALAIGDGLTVSVPELRGFNFVGGMTLSPEFAALLIGLVVYASAFIAELVRSGIQSVPRGQWEAARALGFRPPRILRLIVLPQALRMIVPPLTNQYLNLTKNSSLAIVVGYPELASISNTVINQTGQAIETIAIFMGVYLVLSLATSAGMNWYNARIALRSG